MQNILTLHTPSNALANYRSGVWQDDTLYGLAHRQACERPTSWALRDARVRLNWREAVDWVDSVADALARRGLRPGDRVGVWLPSVVETAIILLACSRNGYVCCPSLHQNHTVDEIVTLLQRMQCRALFATPGHGADADSNSIFDRVADVSSLRTAFTLESDAYPSLPAGTAPFPARIAATMQNEPDPNPDKVVYLAFTSGTTGMPKGVMHSDNTLLANGRAIASDWGHTDKATILTLSPMSHHIATVALEQALVTGAELVITHPGSGQSILDWIIATGATYVMGVPTHAMDLVQELRTRGLASLGTVRTFYMAGAAIPRDIAQAFLNLGVTPQNVYGMTENGSHSYTLPTDTPDAIVATCGRSCQGYEARLWKPDSPDVEAGPGEVGEIGGRGGLLMLGYFDNQSATENSFNAHGWFMSGDLGRIDDHGCLIIVGRKKDLIIRGGHNIYPARIEELAMRHPFVRRAAAYPVQDRRLGEKVCLALVCHTGRAIEPADIFAHLDRCGLSKFDMPEYFLTMDNFPLTASGKVLKRDLADMTRRGELAPLPVNFRDFVPKGE